MIKLHRALLLFGLIVVGLLVMALLGHRSSSRSQLRRYQAELRAKGEKLTFAELVPVPVTNANSSHAQLTNAVAGLKGTKFQPSGWDYRNYVNPGQARVGWRGETPPWSGSSRWVAQMTWEEVTTDLNTVRSPLEQIRAALKEPTPNTGTRTNIFDGSRLNFVAIRSVAQWLAAAAINEVRQGHLDAALENLEALGALARMEREEPTLVAQMIRVAVSGLGLRSTWEALQAPGWTEPQLARLQKAWEPVALLDAAETGFMGERVGGIGVWTLAREGGGRRLSKFFDSVSSGGSGAPKLTFQDVMLEYVAFPAYKLTSIDEDELFYLKTMQEAITAVRLVKAHRPWAEAKQRMDASFAGVNQMANSPQRYRYFLSAISIPNYQKCGITVVHVESERQMTLAAIALKRFQLRYGKLPPDLASLVPEFLPELPWDCLSGKPLCYHLKPDGTFLLYSVGDDGQDNGGDPTPSPGKAAGLWEGRDAVWPLAAK